MLETDDNAMAAATAKNFMGFFVIFPFTANARLIRGPQGLLLQPIIRP